MSEAHGTFILFQQIESPPSNSTLRWEVRAKRDGVLLGSIKWYPGWRTYAFYPAPETIFEKKCLREIADFLHRETQVIKTRPKGLRDLAKGDDSFNGSLS